MTPVNEKTLARLRELERHVKAHGAVGRRDIERILRISTAQAVRVIKAADVYSSLTVCRVYNPFYRKEVLKVTA